MRVRLALVLCILSLSIFASGQVQPCVSGSLANVLGESCSIGNATFTFQNNFSGFHQFADPNGVFHTEPLDTNAIGFVPIVDASKNGFLLITNFDAPTGLTTQLFNEIDATFTYDISVNGAFQVVDETASVQGSATQVNSDNAAAFDQHCFTNQFCIQILPDIGFFSQFGPLGPSSVTQTLGIPGLASNGFFGIPTTELTAFANFGDHAILNSATFLFTVVPQIPIPPLAKLSYQEFQVPGTASTSIGGLNDGGDLVGAYTDPAGATRGFLQDEDGIHDIIVPNAVSTIPNAINNRGDIVGDFSDTFGQFHGFLYRNGTFTTLDFPGAIDTFPLDINDHGVIVGVYQLDAASFHSFRLDDSGFVTIDDPNQHTPTAFSEAFGINNPGDIVGLYLDQDFNSHAFQLRKEVFSEITVPGGFEPSGADISDAQTILGTYQDLDVFTHGFVEEGATFRTVDFPNSAGTFPFQINLSGEIVGEYFDDSGNLHSFVAERQPDDGKTEQPQRPSHHTTLFRKCTAHDGPQVRKNLKNMYSCPAN